MSKCLLIRCDERIRGPLEETNVTGVYPPLGLAYIAAVLRREGHGVRVLDLHALGIPPKRAGQILVAEGSEADILFFTSTTLVWPNCKETAIEARRLFPGAAFVAGGPAVTAYPAESLEGDSPFDMGVYGEGEAQAGKIASHSLDKERPEGIPGTVVRSSGGSAKINPPQQPQDLDLLPFPAVDLLPYRRYRAIAVRRPFYSMITSRGCPYRCSFCSQIYTGNRVRYRSAPNVLDEMEIAWKRYRAREVIIFDETFTSDRERALAVCRGITERGLGFRWTARARPDTLDQELCSSMKRAGMAGVHLGIESGSQRVLDLMGKGTTLDRIRDAVGTCRQNGLYVRGYFMLGYPGEDISEIRRTVSFAKELSLDWASFTITVPHPATGIYLEGLEQGRFRTDFWKEHMLGKRPAGTIYFTSGQYGREELRRMRRRAYLGFYLDPRYVFRRLFSREGIRLIADLLRNAPLVARILAGDREAGR